VAVSTSTSSGEATPTPRNSLGEAGGGVGAALEEASLDVRLSESVQASFSDIILTGEMVQLQQEALVQVCRNLHYF
jgi:hypothetical protein